MSPEPAHRTDPSSANAVQIRPSRPEEGERIVQIWRRAVEATHDFVSAEDLVEIDRDTRAYLQTVPLWVAVDAQDQPMGFMALGENRLDALFIDPTHHGMGVGKALVRHARARHAMLDTEVNAQNTQAIGFYRRLGFVETGYSALDDLRRAYPLIRMRLVSAEGPAASEPR